MAWDFGCLVNARIVEGVQGDYCSFTLEPYH